MNLTSEHRLRADRNETGKLEGWVRDFAQRAAWPDSVRNAVDLALEEWITNIISYAYADRLEHWIMVRLMMAAGEARVEIEDDGREFNPLSRSPVDTSVPLEQRGIGGLGIHMITRIMDAVEYRRVNGRNILTLRKRTA
jgi:anti-sigma regulatory factor (Ser/Thr protein kinase)